MILYLIISFILSAADPFIVTLTNHLLTNNNVTTTLEWPRKAGVFYSVFILPEASPVLTEAMNHNRVIINITIPYNIQYTVTLIADLCGQHNVTTSKVLNYGM